MPLPAPVRTDQKQRLTDGPNKVAAILLALGRPMAGTLLEYFDPAEVRLITRRAAELGQVTPQEIGVLIDEFTQSFAEGTSLYGTANEVAKLLGDVLPPDQVAEIMSDVLGNSNRSIWERVSSGSESVLAAYLMKEHPQTIALVLSKVKPSCAAKVMAQLPQELRNQLMRRMLSFKPMVDETLRIIERTLHEDFMVNLGRNMQEDTHSRMADIINKMERDHMDDVLQNLSITRPKSAEVLRGLLFTFEDIIKLQPRARMSIFDQVPTEKIVLALKGTELGFRDAILSSLASRARRLVETELSNSEPAPQRDVLDARRSIADLALEMAGRGEIELGNDQEDEAYFR
jgi:flagellar motor switch protein FliG